MGHCGWFLFFLRLICFYNFILANLELCCILKSLVPKNTAFIPYFKVKNSRVFDIAFVVSKNKTTF
ncbi:hypothetical protein AAX10_02145 [Moraxella bovoculi]|nr:hypothetical protein AAX10_02145 [Moraxella bovoculi]